MQLLKFLKYDKANSVAVIMINRPEVRNAMTVHAWRELDICLDDAENDKQVRTIILTGAGEKAFIAGGDIQDLKNRTPQMQWDDPVSLRVTQKIEQIEKPVIAAINGIAVGGGLEVALACDIRIATEKARFILPELNLGLIPGAGGTQRLVRIVGLGRAKEMVITGKTYTAEEAYLFGLLTEVVKGTKLMERAIEIAEDLARKSPMAMSISKRILNQAIDSSLAEGLLTEQLGFINTLYSEDHTEGLSAFLEKRIPNFKGK